MSTRFLSSLAICERETDQQHPRSQATPSPKAARRREASSATLRNQRSEPAPFWRRQPSPSPPCSGRRRRPRRRRGAGAPPRPRPMARGGSWWRGSSADASAAAQGLAIRRGARGTAAVSSSPRERQVAHALLPADPPPIAPTRRRSPPRRRARRARRPAAPPTATARSRRRRARRASRPSRRPPATPATAARPAASRRSSSRCRR
jgi:hypothetical protein